MSDILEELFPDPSSVHKEDCEFFFGSGGQSDLLSACLKLITTNPQISLSKNTLTSPKSEDEGLSKSNPYLLWLWAWLIKIFIIILIIVAMIFF